jgi:hypothetical protein
VIPYISLRGHEQAAGDLSFVIDNVGHHPFEVFKLLGIQLTHAALRQRRFQHGIRICAGGGGIGVAIQKAGSAPTVAVAAVKAVQQLACRHRRLIAVGSPVMEQSCCPVVGIVGGLDAGSCAGCGQRGSRKQRQ